MQATWLTEAVCHWVKKDWLQTDPESAFKLSLKVTGYGNRDLAIKFIAASWDVERVVQMLRLTAHCSMDEQREMLAVLCRFANLDEVPPFPYS